MEMDTSESSSSEDEEEEEEEEEEQDHSGEEDEDDEDDKDEVAANDDGQSHNVISDAQIVTPTHPQLVAAAVEGSRSVNGEELEEVDMDLESSDSEDDLEYEPAAPTSAEFESESVADKLPLETQGDSEQRTDADSQVRYMHA